jgi:proline utilization trans-activator
MTIGLHHNLPHTVVIDPVVRQHRVRLWWTIYICDRMWGSKLGHPLIIQDSDISVDLPSMLDLNDRERAMFPDPDYIISSIKLARIAGSIISTIYCRGQPPPFVQSVQKILRDLNGWVATLPNPIKLAQVGGFTPRHIVSLHLSFNQV